MTTLTVAAADHAQTIEPLVLVPTLVVLTSFHDHAIGHVIFPQTLVVIAADFGNTVENIKITRAFYEIVDENLTPGFAILPITLNPEVIHPIWAQCRTPLTLIPHFTQPVQCSDVLNAVWTWFVGTELYPLVQVDVTLSLMATLAQSMTVDDAPKITLGLSSTEALDVGVVVGIQPIVVCFVAEALSVLLETTAHVDLKALLQESVSSQDAFTWVARLLHQDSLDVSSDTSFVSALKVAELLRAEIASAPNLSLFFQASENPLVGAAVLWIAKLTQREAVTVEDLSSADFIQVLRVVEAIHAVGEIMPALWVAFKANERLTVEDLATLADLLVVAEGLLVSTDASVDLTAPFMAAEQVVARDRHTPSWTFLLAARETLDADTNIAPSLSVLLTAKESLSLITRLPLGDEDFQAFVINTDTLGVTQYTNFPFNSLAEFNNRLYGVTETGLYELTGATDDGEAIQASLRTGDLSWGDLAELNVPRAYLYFNSDNQAYLKTISTLRGQRAEHWYEISLMTGDEQSRRIKLGRGVRGVRWAFELTNIDGGSLNLREFTVLPVVMRRRRGG